MAEDKIWKIAARLSEQMPPHFRKAETTRAERILREELEGLIEAVQEVCRATRTKTAGDLVDHRMEVAFDRLEKHRHGWPWRKS